MASGSKVGSFPRLLRAQFTPIMIAPVVLGTAVAWSSERAFVPGLFLLALAGAVSLHLAANGIDDVYDYINGADQVSERMFPPDAPSWKPIPRGMLTVGEAFKVSYFFYGLSLLIGAALSLLVGWYALAIAAPGILLSYFYTAPPLRLDYRGLGLGELSILFSFGPIPALGAYYVMAGHLATLPVLVALPSGLLTTSILISHDIIYYDAYKAAGKRSITVVLGRSKAATLSASLSVLGYALLPVMVAVGLVPTSGLVAFAALPLLLRSAGLRRNGNGPEEYGARTMAAFLDSTVFTLLLAAGFLIG
jgi:1,4-dihydroxy-2-naphthoate polyprenyltransferase